MGLNYFFTCFRWKGENVATTEVSDVIVMLDFIQEANVYGVSVPGKRPLAVWFSSPRLVVNPHNYFILCFKTVYHFWLSHLL